MENMKDSAFKFFVILLQPAKSLNVTDEYIICFLSRKTYLERDDPELFKKMSKYLIWVKKKTKKRLEPEDKEQFPEIDGNGLETI